MKNSWNCLALALSTLSLPAQASVMIDVRVVAPSETTHSSNGEQGTEAASSGFDRAEIVDTILNNTVANYASMLPAPSEWVLLLIGFAVIGYAMRSRKRGRVSFT